MQIGGAEVQVVMTVGRRVGVLVGFFMPVPVAVAVAVSVMMGLAAQQPGAGEVHEQPERRHRDGLVVMDRRRREQPLDRLPQHQPRDADQQQRAAVAAQHLDLPGPEREAAVLRPAPRRAIGQHRDAQRHRVRAHVPAVGQQRHRVEDITAGDLRDHHRDGEQHGPARVAGGQRVALVKDMRVLPGGDGGRGRHGKSRSRPALSYSPPV